MNRHAVRNAHSFAAALLVAAIELTAPWAAAFDVDTTIDSTDAIPGDGVCDDGSGACSLRAAVEESNALSGMDEITVPAGLYVLTLRGHGVLTVSDETHIVGTDRDTTIIDGDAFDGVLGLDVDATEKAIVENVTIRNGYAGAGGGIFGRGELRNVLVTENNALNEGGGLAGEFVVIDSVISNNVGGGISTLDSGNQLEMVNSRVVYNAGDGILCGYEAHCNVTDTYIGANTGAGIRQYSGDGNIDIENTIVEANGSGVEVAIDSGVTIHGGAIRNNFSDGLVGDRASGILVGGTDVSGNRGIGIVAFEDCEQLFITVIVSGATITGNGGGGIYIQSDPPDHPCGYPEIGHSVLAGNGYGVHAVDCLGRGHLRSLGHNTIEDPGTCIILGDRTDVCGIPPGPCPIATTTTTTTVTTTSLGPTTTSIPRSPQCGDVTNDGDISVTDALVVLIAAVGGSDCDPPVCDSTGDGSITTADALLVLRAAVGLNVTLQCT